VCWCNAYSYPKGLLVAFTLKSKSSGGDKQNGAKKPVTEVEGETAANTSEDTEKLSENDKNGTDASVEGSEEKDAQETPGSKGKEVKDGEELSEGADKKGPEEPVSQEKTAIEVSREDLKPIFEKFGTVKVLVFHNLLRDCKLCTFALMLFILITFSFCPVSLFAHLISVRRCGHDMITRDHWLVAPRNL